MRPDAEQYPLLLHLPFALSCPFMVPWPSFLRQRKLPPDPCLPVFEVVAQISRRSGHDVRGPQVWRTRSYGSGVVFRCSPSSVRPRTGQDAVTAMICNWPAQSIQRDEITGQKDKPGSSKLRRRRSWHSHATGTFIGWNDLRRGDQDELTCN